MEMKRSIIAFIGTLVLGLLSMGLLGALLYYAVYPVLAPYFGDPDDWHGDRVWPSLILAGMGWSFSFLAAGLLNLRLEKAGWRLRSRRAVYLAILWLGAVVIWLIILLSRVFQ
jgi:MFS family permease